MKINEPLKSNEIEFRIQSINKGDYATIIPYKNARVDMERLDSVYGVEGWQRKHEFKNGILYCSVGIYSESRKEWVWKEDVGTQSNAEAEKGQASDSFKRACFNIGIGRELYDYPVISIKLNRQQGGDERYGECYTNNNKVVAGWGLKLKDWAWFSEFDENNRVTFLGAKDQNGVIRFQWGAQTNNSNQ